MSFENCGKESSDIKLLNLTVTPDPIVAPGSAFINLTLYTNQNLTSPLKVNTNLIDNHQNLKFSAHISGSIVNQKKDFYRLFTSTLLHYWFMYI